MTEQTVPFSATAVAAPPAPLLPTDMDDAGDAGNRRKLAVVGAVVAVLVALVAAFFLMKGSGSSDNTATGAVPHGTPADTSTGGAAPAATKHKPVKLPKKFKGDIGRDPFKALYTPPVIAPAPTVSATDTSGTTGTTTDVTSVDPTTTVTDTTTTTTVTPTSPKYRPVWIMLTHVGSSGAKFDVGFSNHKSLRVVKKHVTLSTDGTPTTFARNFALLGISNGSVVLQFGDGSPFRLDMKRNVMIVN